MLLIETSSKELELVKNLIKQIIKNTKFEKIVYVCGGAVRDKIMGREIKDIDLLVTAPNGGMELAEFIGSKINRKPVLFANFGTAKVSFAGVTYKGHKFSNGVDVELVHPRKESYRGTSRKPETEYGTIEDDAFRRDFTINSLYENLTTGEIIDISGHGIEDIKNGIIRATSDPNIIFGEDPLRILRGIRFLVKYNLEIADDTLHGMKTNSPKIVNISAERVQEEFRKILTFDSCADAFILMNDINLLKHLGITVSNKTLGYMNAFNTLNANFAILFLDMYKSGGFVNNIKNLMVKLKFESNEIKALHVLYNSYDLLIQSSDQYTLNKVVYEYNANINDLILFLSSIGLGQVSQKVKNTKKLTIPLTGDEIMSHFNIKSGKEIGEFLKKAKDMVYADPNTSKEDIFNKLESE